MARMDEHCVHESFPGVPLSSYIRCRRGSMGGALRVRRCTFSQIGEHFGLWPSFSSGRPLALTLEALRARLGSRRSGHGLAGLLGGGLARWCCFGISLCSESIGGPPWYKFCHQLRRV